MEGAFMLFTLAAISLGAGLLGLVYATLSPRSDPALRWQVLSRAGARYVLIAVIVLAVAALALALLHNEGRLRWGVLVGAVAGLLAFSITALRGPDDGGVPYFVGLVSAALLGPCVALLQFPTYPNETLMGCAIGAALPAAIASGVLRRGEEQTAGPADEMTAGLTFFALTTAVLSVAARFAIVAHGMSDSPGHWAIPGLLVAIGLLVVLLFGGAKFKQMSMNWAVIVGVIAAVVVVFAAFILQARLVPALPWRSLLWGVVAFGVIMLLLLLHEGDVETTRPVALALGTALAALALLALGYRGTRATGDALAVIPALFVIGLPWLSGRRSRMTLSVSLGMGAAMIVLLVVIQRLLVTRLPTLPAMDFQQMYDLLALLLGAMIPFTALALSGNAPAREQEEAPAEPGIREVLPAWVRTAVIGLMLAAAAVLPAALWGGHASVAFLTGLPIGLAAWMLLLTVTTGADRARALTGAPFAVLLGTALLAVQFAPVAATWALPRATKVIIVCVILACVVVWMAVENAGKGHKRDKQLGEAAVTSAE
jgi:hypothetical protein